MSSTFRRNCWASHCNFAAFLPRSGSQSSCWTSVWLAVATPAIVPPVARKRLPWSAQEQFTLNRQRDLQVLAHGALGAPNISSGYAVQDLQVGGHDPLEQTAFFRHFGPNLCHQIPDGIE